jgi:hypothetical protein
MRLFHQTKTQHAESIWSDGFRDSEVIVDDGCAGEKFIGVRLFDNPIGWNPNPDGNNLLLAIEIPEHAISEYEWLTAAETRQFFVPALVVNIYGPPVVEEVDLLGGILDGIDLSGI